MSTMASQITGASIVYSTVHSCTYQRKHQSLVSLAFGRGIHRWPVNSPHKGPVMRKMFPFDDIIMHLRLGCCLCPISQWVWQKIPSTNFANEQLGRVFIFLLFLQVTIDHLWIEISTAGNEHRHTNLLWHSCRSSIGSVGRHRWTAWKDSCRPYTDYTARDPSHPGLLGEEVAGTPQVQHGDQHWGSHHTIQSDLIITQYDYRQTSNISRTLLGNKIVDHSDVVGASPVGAAPTTSSFST